MKHSLFAYDVDIDINIILIQVTLTVHTWSYITLSTSLTWVQSLTAEVLQKKRQNSRCLRWTQFGVEFVFLVGYFCLISCWLLTPPPSKSEHSHIIYFMWAWGLPIVHCAKVLCPTHIQDTGLLLCTVDHWQTLPMPMSESNARN